MNTKISRQKKWIIFTLIFGMICFVAFSKWAIPVFILYLIASVFIFQKDFLGFFGNVYMIIKNAEKALKLYELAIEKNSKDPVVFHNYARLLMDEGEIDKSIDILKKGLLLDLDSFSDKSIHLSLSTCFWIKGDIDKAIYILEGLLEKYEYISENFYTTIGYYYFLKDDFEKATEYSKKAIEQNSEYASAWDNLGQIYFKQNDLVQSKESFERALSYNEYLVDSNYYLACVYEIDGELDFAREYFEKASKCSISKFNTVKIEEVNEKLAKYV